MSTNFLLKLTYLCFFIFNLANVVLSQEYISSFPEKATQISNLNIKAFCQDSLGDMWIATPRGLNRYNGYEFLQYFHATFDSTSINNDFVNSLFKDSSHRLWIGTPTGIDRYDFETNHFEHYPVVENKLPIVVHSFFEDHQKNIWVATEVGGAIIDTINNHVVVQKSTNNKRINLFWEDNSKKLWMGLNETKGLAVQRDKDNWDYFALPGARKVICLYRDLQGIWWLGTNAGIVLFDPAFQIFKDPSGALKDNILLNHTQINFIKEISPLKLLIGTDSHGLFQYDILSKTLMHNKLNQKDTIRSSQLLSCYVDRDLNIWLGSFDNGLMVWNRCLDYFNSDHYLSDLFKDKFVTRVVEDNYRNLWVSTRYHGLFNYTSSGKITVYNVKNSDLFSNDNCLIESLFIDSFNRIWIGMTNELIVAKILQDGHLQVLARKNLEWIVSMQEDSSGNLWLGSSLSGLYRIKKNDPTLMPELIYNGNVPDICILGSDSLLFSSYDKGIFLLNPEEKDPMQVFSFSKDAKRITKHCITIYKDKQHRIWLGSYGAGLLCVSSNQKHYHIFDKKRGLPSNDVLRLEEGSHGDMWLSTSFGISKLRMNDTTFVNYFSSDGTLGNQYHEKAGLKHSDGRIFFAGNHGLTFFNPMVDMPQKSPPTVCLTDFKILNQSIRPSSGSVLTKSIPFTNQITLNYRQPIISIDYTGIDFLFPYKLTYAYKLEGFDENWNFVGDYRRATYSNLNPGEYTFQVKAINGDGVESTSLATLKIKVKPAPWFSWPAWFAYILAVITIIYLLFRLVLNMRINRHKLATVHREQDRERQISEMKINFFTNISHELRTPLTLISAPLEQLSSLKRLDNNSEYLLHTVSRNVQSMLRLINQLLDFRKMESGMLNLQVQQTDVIQFIRNIQEAFVYSAIGKQVTLDFVPHVTSLPVWMDTDKVEKILYNLLSNAFKFTPRKGKVQIITRMLGLDEALQKYQITDYAYLEIIVTDTGPGIPEDKLHELFVRYRQIEGPSGRKPDYGGSGIGLNYTKRLVETHYGKIQARIQQEGGMSFSFVLPMGDIYSESDKLSVRDNFTVVMNMPTQQAEKPDEERKIGYTILVVEDNVELMGYIRNLLKNQYELIEALDGTIAWSLVQSNSPDLILSDVLMPGLTGYELCRQVKQHPEFCHIPVILLTAKSTVSDQLEGLELGADAYICKPFHIDYLLLTVRNLFMSRTRLRQYFSTPQIPNQTVLPVVLNKHDQEFMDKLTQIIEQELANSDFNIDRLAREMGFSRTGFYRKIKGLSDMSPNDFLRSYRLRRAAEMIKENSLSLNEIASYTGFNYYPYFSKSFKKQLGVSPKDYAKTT